MELPRLEILGLTSAVIRTSIGATLYSYDVPIVTKTPTKYTILHKDWDYSVTTSKHRNKFTGGKKKELLDSEYTLTEVEARIKGLI